MLLTSIQIGYCYRHSGSPCAQKNADKAEVYHLGNNSILGRGAGNW